jgi:hypothetical protein
MEEQVTQVMEDNGQVRESDFLTSLSERARARRQQLQRQRTVILKVPGWENWLEVEYRALSWAEMRMISGRHERISDDATRDLYVAADTLILASVNSYALDDEGKRHELGLHWGIELAQRFGVDVDEGTTARRAVMSFFFHDLQLMGHCNMDYGEWLQSTEEDIDREEHEVFPPSR